MGFRSSWIAVEKNAAEMALKKTELRATDNVGEELDTGWWGLSLNDWFVVIGSGWDHMERVTEQQAKELSLHSRSLFWTADDSEMCARMVEYRDGEMLWSLEHADGNPIVTGDAPALLREVLRQQQEMQQAESDMVDHLYGVAHLVGVGMVGFRHDESEPPAGSKFIVLRPHDEPEPVRVVKKQGVFRVEFMTDHHGASEVNIEATEAVHVEQFLTLTFQDDELQGVIAHAGGQMAPGDRRQFWLSGPNTQMTIVTSEQSGSESIEIKSPTPPQ